MSEVNRNAPPAQVSRAWLRSTLGLPEDDPDRLVDILHARYCADPPATHALLGRTLDVSAATVRKREHAALTLLDAVICEGIEEGDRLHHALVALNAEQEPAPAPGTVIFEPAPELASAVEATATATTTVRKR